MKMLIMFKVIIYMFLLLSLAFFAFLISFTIINWLWANYITVSGSYPDQKYFTWNLSINLPFAALYTLCAFIAQIVNLKILFSEPTLKLYMLTIVGAVIYSLLIYLVDYIPTGTSNIFVLIPLFTVPILAIVINLLVFFIYKLSTP